MEFNRFLEEDYYLHQTQHHEQFKPNEVCCCKCDKLMEMIQDLKSSFKEEIEALKRVILPHFSSEQDSTPPATSCSRSQPCQAEPTASKMLHLRINDHCLPETLFTMNKIQHQGGSLEVELVDDSGCRVEDSPESSAKIRMGVLNGEFEVEDNDWSEEDFDKNLVRPRKDKASSLLKGKCEVSLSRGVANVGDLCFTDNSKRNGTFRLGAQVMKCPPGVNIRAAVSKAFTVKERRLLCDRKHEKPTLEDELWRLKNIRRDGPVYKRAKEASIHTVKDFLQLLHTDPKRMQQILDVPETKWKEIVENAEACELSTDNCRYCDETTGVELLLNCAFDIVSITFRGQISQAYGTLNDHQKHIVNKVRSDAYEIRTQLETYTPNNQMLVQADQPFMHSTPSIDIPHYEPTFRQIQAQFSSASSIQSMYMHHPGATSAQQGEPVVLADSYLHGPLSYQFDHENPELGVSGGQLQDDPEWINRLISELRDPPEVPTKNNHTSKLLAACYVTKAATMFMIAIKQDGSHPKKKRKFQ